MKETRKNKTKLVMNMPNTAYYTLDELFSINTHFSAEITIRSRHKKLEESGEVAEVGNIVGGHGRPKKVYAKTPITQLLLNKIQADGINLVDNANILVNAVSVKNSSTPVVKTSILTPA